MCILIIQSGWCKFALHQLPPTFRHIRRSRLIKQVKMVLTTRTRYYEARRHIFLVRFQYVVLLFGWSFNACHILPHQAEIYTFIVPLCNWITGKIKSQFSPQTRLPASILNCLKSSVSIYLLC